MTLSFKHFIPYNEAELQKGIKKIPLDANWKIVSMKQYDDDEDSYKISFQHINTKLKTPELIIENNITEDKRHRQIGYIHVEHQGNRSNFSCVYGTYDERYLRAICKVLRNPYFIMDVLNLKSTKSPYEYCIKKFGPIFDNPRCSEWQLHL